MIFILQDTRTEIKENENWDKYMDLAGKLKRPWNMKVTVEFYLMPLE